ncbi:MAG: DUF2147 domain-containing protein [Sphingomicrobium sp.]
MKTMFAAFAALLTTPAFAAAPIEGNWANPARSVTVRIGQCGGTLCGRVIAASAHARAKAADAGTDRLIGTELMSDLDPIGPGAWRAEIFVPDRNIRADGELHLVGPRALEVRGCAMGGLICKTQTWTRVGGAARRRR